MSFESPGFAAHRADAPQRTGLFVAHRASLAPPADRIRGSRRDTALAGWFAKTLGVVILSLSALFVAALLTWSIADPSFSNVGAGLKAKNALGPIGAILSDVVIQSLGLASVFGLLPPVFWAAQLLSRNGIDGARSKLLMAPVAVLCLAAFLSSLPRAAVWPLGSGYGGLLGDFGFQFVTGLFGIVNAERAPLVTGVCLMAAGFSMLMLSMGVTPADLKRMVERRRTHVPDSGWVSHLKAAVVVSASDEDVLAAGPTTRASATAAAAVQTREPMLPMPAAAMAAEPVPVPVLAPEPIVAAAPVVPPKPVHDRVADNRAVATAAAPISPPISPAHVGAQATAARPPRLGYRRPPQTLLPQTTSPRSSARDLHVAEKLRARKLVGVLATFGVHGEVADHVVGPIVTTFTVEPAAGTRASRLVGLADDIARSMGAVSVRIRSTAARNSVLVEMSHDDPVCLGLRDFIADDSFQNARHVIPVVLGASARGEPCVADLADASMLVGAHERVARDALIDTIVTSLVYRHTPATLRFVFLATDGASARGFQRWSGLPHVAVPPAVDLAHATDLLAWAAAEIDARTLRMRAVAQARTIDDHNQRLGADGRTDIAPIPHLVLVIGDLAALVRDGDAGRLTALDTILRRGKFAGVHVVAATPSAVEDSLSGPLVAAFPVRLAARLSSKAESRAMFGDAGAEDLAGDTDILVVAGVDRLRASFGAPQRLHAALIRPTEAVAIAAAAATHVDLDQPTSAAGNGTVRDMQRSLQVEWPETSGDSLYERAVAIVRRQRSADVAMLKRDLSLTSAMASELMEQMTRHGVLPAGTDRSSSGEPHRNASLG